MRTIGQWLRHQQAIRSKRIADAQAEVTRYHEDRAQEDAVLDGTPPPWTCNYSKSRWAGANRDLQDDLRRIEESYPEPTLSQRRSWGWYLRWTGIVLLSYVGIAFMAHALRHPEMTETQRFLDFWNALLWR